MSIFNSLGSNYSTNFIFKYLFSSSRKSAAQQVKAKLSEHFGGAVTLTYKGRQALELALTHSHLPQGSFVGINGFTCYVLYQAVERAGYKPVFIDVEENSLNFGVLQLEAALKTSPIKAIIVQNTLGLPAPIEELADYCKKHNILIIEDLAHSLGMYYAKGLEAGKVGKLVMLSFSQDKPLDVVAGGALIDRRPNGETEANLKQIGLKQRLINRAYPFWSSSIRWIYGSGLGRFLHAGLKLLHLLATPMSDNLVGRYDMTRKSASLLLGKWDQRESEFAHRRKIAEIYSSLFPADVQYKVLGKGALFLRFPIKVANRQGLIQGLKNFQIYIGDTWYDAPIGPKRYLAKTNYQAGECPNSEKIASEIINLPTHFNINEKQARLIAAKVNQWLQSK